MSHTFLMEIGLEEIPAHVVTPSAAQLVEKTEKFLKEQRMDFFSSFITKLYSFAPQRL